MPLVRYEVRCEHSLANPELYRTAVRDDSEGLLEGVAMAGLVGLVRQLGDLAEFAAEIFHDLHVDIVNIVSRGQNLKTRVTRLEADLPVVEKTLVAKASQFRFAYTARSQWRAPLPMDQNLCAQMELPRFVRNLYDDCRGPPRLFLLDKFDGDGQGACVKRYTDPTFFRLTWATSQLEKAEQAELERQEQLELQVQQERKSSMKKVSNNVHRRERLSSAHFENLEGFTGDFTPELRSMRLDRVSEGGDLTPEEPQSPEKKSLSKWHQQMPQVDRGPALASLKISAKDVENTKQGRRMQTPSSDDEGGSDYVDALTTAGSDVDSEHGRSSARKSVDSARKSVDSARLSADSEQDSRHRESASQNHSVLKAQVEAQRQAPFESPSVDQDQHGEFAQRLDPDSPESPKAGTAEWEPPADQPATEDAEVRKTITTDDARVSDHASIADSPTLPDTILEPPQKPSGKVLEPPAYAPLSFDDVSTARGEEHGVSAEARDQSLKSEEAPQARQDEQPTLADVEQPVTAPRSRRQWAKDNGSGSKFVLSKVDINHNEDSDVTSLRLRARLWESTGVSALVLHRGEEDLGMKESQRGYELSRRSTSSDNSSPYTNISSSEGDDGFTSESASSSPKGVPNFCTLLSPPQSPPRGLMSSYDANPARSERSSPRPPPITPLLASSPSVSRSSSVKHDAAAGSKLAQNSLGQVRSSARPPPQPKPPRSSLSPQTIDFQTVANSAESSEKIKEILVTEPRRKSENGSLKLEPSRSQDPTSTLLSPATKPRTWTDRSESNVAATLRAIRQAAVVGSDDDTASECRSDCS